MLFKEIRAVYCANYRNHMKKINHAVDKIWTSFNVNACGTYSALQT